MGYGWGGGIVGLIILALDIWAIIQIVGSAASAAAKVIWVIVVLVLPVIGLIIWLIAGPRSAPAIRP